jgi:hypothetical protein
MHIFCFPTSIPLPFIVNVVINDLQPSQYLAGELRWKTRREVHWALQSGHGRKDASLESCTSQWGGGKAITEALPLVLFKLKTSVRFSNILYRWPRCIQVQRIASGRWEQNSDLQDHNHTNLDVRPGVMGLRQTLQQSHYPTKPIQDPSNDSRRTMVCHKLRTALRPRDTYRTRRHPSQNQKIPHQTCNPQKSAPKDAADTRRHQTSKTILANRPDKLR